MKSLVHSKLFPAHIISPFDLHVLSTPPAFILSQDQTLLFLWDPQILAKAKLGFFLLYCFFLGSFFVRSFFFLWNHSAASSLRLPPSGLHSFGIFQGCITVYLSRFCVLLQGFSCFWPATALLSYHAQGPLSSTFFTFFIFLYKISTHRSGGGILI